MIHHRHGTPRHPASLTALIDELDRRVSYRKLDYWLRRGTVWIASDARGTGSRRQLTPAEAAAITDVVDELQRLRAAETRVRDGEYFAERLAHHERQEVAS